ncbi:MAG: polysaccharide deacetylase family protein [Armatimonadetes bacterium]|nr:polysaccharide deacetylase family protein [Armatimonadota bacterium]
MSPNKLTGVQAMAILRADRDPVWQRARAEVYRSVEDLLAQQRLQVGNELRCPTIMRGDTRKPQIALTFDDGPHPGYTYQILRILRQENVKATFFVVGEQAERYPDLVRDQIRGEHCVGNHTYHHVSLTKIPELYVADEIKACGDVLRHITGRAPHLFRPPGGDYNARVTDAARALGYTMVLWSDDPGDYASPGAFKIAQRTLRCAGNGGILLLHDGIQQTVDILPSLIDTLRKRGYEFVTVDQMLGRSRGRVNMRTDPIPPAPTAHPFR